MTTPALDIQEENRKLDKRDLGLLHKVWSAASEAMWKQSQGHADGWVKLLKALDNAEDEMGPPEEYKSYL